MNLSKKIIIFTILVFLLNEVHKYNLTNENFNNSYKSEQYSFDPRNVQVMIFQKNKYTSANRTSPKPQLKCVGDNAMDKSFIVN